MLVIGLTGGLCSGKSTVARLFAENGVPVIDADQIARDLVKPDTSSFKKIVGHFGDEILKNGAINRQALGKIVFADSQQRRWLENLLHPQIRQVIEKKIQQLHNDPLIVIEIPLLRSREGYPYLDRVLVVDVDENTQTHRARQRDKLDVERIKQIIAAQPSRQQRLSLADDVLNNDADEKVLRQHVDALYLKYTQ